MGSMSQKNEERDIPADADWIIFKVYGKKIKRMVRRCMPRKKDMGCLLAEELVRMGLTTSQLHVTASAILECKYTFDGVQHGESSLYAHLSQRSRVKSSCIWDNVVCTKPYLGVRLFGLNPV